MSTGRRSSVRSRRSSRSGSKRKENDPLEQLQAFREQVEPQVKEAWTKYGVPTLATIWGFSALIWTFVVGYSLQKVVLLIDSFKEAKDRMKKREKVLTMGELFHTTASVLCVHANPFWGRVVEYEVPYEELPKSCVFMGNHTSFVDPFVLCGVIPEAKSAGQSVLWKIPVVGGVLDNNGDMPVHFEKKANGKWGTREGSASELLQNAEEYLKDDVPVAVFPEGTITKDGHLKRFKPGFFKVALAAGVPIVPIAMWGNQELWPMQLSKKDVSTPALTLGMGTTYIKVGSPIPTEGKELDELMEEVQNKIDTMVRSLPNYSLDVYSK